jgi:integrase
MPRKPEGRWDPRRGRYYAALGPWYTSPRSGRRRRKTVVLTHPDGTPVRQGDRPGRLEAIARLMREAGDEDRRVAYPTARTLFALWADWHEGHGSSPTTVESYRKRARTICEVPDPQGRGVLGDLPADAFAEAHLFAVRATLRARGVSEGVQSAHDRIVMACFRWAAQAVEGRVPLVILQRNPFPRGSVRGLRPARSDRPCPTWDELLPTLDKLDEHAGRSGRGITDEDRLRARVNALAVRVIAERGCRPREVVTLRVEQFVRGEDFQGFELGRHKTTHKGVAGVIPLTDETAARVRALIDDPGRAGPWVFDPRRPEGAPPPGTAYLRAWWERQRDAIGASGVALKDFRNTVSNHLRKAGVGGRALQLALRHTQEVAESTYRRDLLGDAAAVFRDAGLG